MAQPGLQRLRHPRLQPRIHRHRRIDVTRYLGPRLAYRHLHRRCPARLLERVVPDLPCGRRHCDDAPDAAETAHGHRQRGGDPQGHEDPHRWQEVTHGGLARGQRMGIQPQRQSDRRPAQRYRCGRDHLLRLHPLLETDQQHHPLRQLLHRHGDRSPRPQRRDSGDTLPGQHRLHLPTARIRGFHLAAHERLDRPHDHHGELRRTGSQS